MKQFIYILSKSIVADNVRRKHEKIVFCVPTSATRPIFSPMKQFIYILSKSWRIKGRAIVADKNDFTRKKQLPSAKINKL